MSVIRRGAQSLVGGLGRDSRLVTAIRPAYEWWLRWSSNGRGIRQTVNGRERFRIDPRYRIHFPEVYEPAVCAHLRERVRRGAVCLNLGAHVGVYALCLAEWSGPTGRVYAFEPNPRTRAVLENHVALNERQGWIEVVPLAVGDFSGDATLFTAESVQFSPLSRLGAPNPDVPGATPVRIGIRVTTLDAFCHVRGLQPDWIVMDVEGYEVAALRGAAELVRRGRDHLGIVAEMHPNLWEPAGESRAAMERLLADLGLRPVALTGQQDALGEHGMVRLEYAT